MPKAPMYLIFCSHSSLHFMLIICIWQSYILGIVVF